MDKLKASQKKKAHYDRIYRELYRVASAGLDWALDSGTIKRLKAPRSPIPLYELRCLPGTTRVMLYLHPEKRDRLVVLLFGFEGHKAHKSTGGIRKEDLTRGQELAEIARALMEEKETFLDG